MLLLVIPFERRSLECTKWAGGWFRGHDKPWQSEQSAGRQTLREQFLKMVLGEEVADNPKLILARALVFLESYLCDAVWRVGALEVGACRFISCGLERVKMGRFVA